MELEKVLRYPPVVSLEENDGKVYYRATFKEFPDMIGGIGDTVDEAIKAAFEMLDAEIEYLEEEGFDVPSPIVKTLSPEASGRVTLRMSKSLHKQVIMIAEEENISINSLINEAISYWIGRKDQRSRTRKKLAEHISLLICEGSDQTEHYIIQDPFPPISHLQIDMSRTNDLKSA